MPTTHTTPIDLRGFHGREFEGVITGYGTPLSCKGKIYVNENGDVYLCQNTENGMIAHELFGFKYSWRVQWSDRKVWSTEQLISITILDPPSSADPRWDWKDGEIVTMPGAGNYRTRVLGENVVSFIYNEGNLMEGISALRTFRQAYRDGYRKLPSPPTRKLTEITEEMFRSTAWGNKKVMYNAVEQGIYGVDYYGKCFILVQNGTQHYSQCKLIEE